MKQFVDELSRIFASSSEIEHLLFVSEIPKNALPPLTGMSPRAFWQHACQALMHGLVVGGVTQLAAAATGLYPGNSVFRETLQTLKGDEEVREIDSQRAESRSKDPPARKQHPAAVRIFISFAHEDEAYFRRLSAHLALLRRSGVISEWHARMLLAGSDWSQEIDEYIDKAELILLLVSPDFINSDYSYEREIHRALVRHAAREARVIPIFIRPVDIHGAPWAALRGLPRNGKAVITWRDQDEAWSEVVTEIRHVVKSIRLQSESVGQTRELKLSVSIEESSATSQRAQGADMGIPAQPMPMEGAHSAAVRVCIVAERRDASAHDEFEKRLLSLIRLDRVRLEKRFLETGEASPLAIYPQISGDAEILIVVLGPELLNSDAATDAALDALLDLSRTRRVSVMPIVYRACDWRSTPFSRFPVRPFDGAAIRDGYGEDARWEEVVKAVALLISARDPSSMSTLAPSPPEHYKLGEVFKTVGFPNLTFVTPTVYPDLVEELSRPGHILVVEGPSGVGKTVATEQALKELREKRLQDWPERWLAANLPADVREIKGLPDKKIDEVRGHLIIDDFHVLDAVDRERIGRFAKVYADKAQHGKITLIGINHARASLIDAVGDLATRARVISLGYESNDRIVELINKGEAKLNVRFERKSEFALTANGSFVVVQMMCESALRRRRIMHTLSSVVAVETDPSTIVPAVIEELKNQFHVKLKAFGQLDDKYKGPRGAAIALLWHLGQAQKGSVHIDDVRPTTPNLAGSFDALLACTAHLRKSGVVPPWRSLLECDPDSGMMAVDDPKFGFYLRHLNWTDFAGACGVRVKRTVEGRLIFLDAPAIEPPEAGVPVTTTLARELRVLHLSDFHFSSRTAWDADTLLDRLAADIGRQRREGLEPDLIVITGDVAFSGKAEEYDLARKWIEEKLLRAANLTPGQLVIVPGNHDAERKKIGRAAAALQKDLLQSARQADVAAALAEEGDRGVLLARHEAFIKFIDDLKVAGRRWELPWGGVSLDVRGTRVHVAALCSSWMSKDDEDHGRLLLGLVQVNESFQGAKGAGLVISAMHHPWSYFADFDRPSRAEVQRTSSIVLHGHLHEAESITQHRPMHGDVLELAAGASYDSSEFPNSYHFIKADLKAGTVEVYPRCWNNAHRDWIADLNLFQGRKGEFKLAKRP